MAKKVKYIKKQMSAGLCVFALLFDVLDTANLRRQALL